MNQSILDIIQLNFTLIGYGHRNEGRLIKGFLTKDLGENTLENW
jgi:hypothetical protein